MKENLQKKVSCFVAILTLLLLIFPAGLKAQESQNATTTYTSYAFSASSETFTYITGGTGVSSIHQDDAYSEALPIGFNFKFGCLGYTQIYASSNGVLSFSGRPLYDNNTTPDSSWKFLAPLWDDLHGGEGAARYVTTGTAPNRVFTMEWKNWRNRDTNPSKNMSFQVKLYEGTNVIQYMYKQEIPVVTGSQSASIGLFDGSPAAKQRWLNDASASPTVSSTKTSNIATRPATNQVYTFTPDNNSCVAVCIGRTTLNNSGGTSDANGLQIIMSGAGNLQIVRNGTGQIYKSDDRLSTGTSSPYAVPGSTHGLVLGIGGTQYRTGTLNASSGFSDGGQLTVISNTCQGDTGPDANGIERNKIRLKATKNGMDYFLNVYYYYRRPETFMTIDYEVEIPTDNKEVVRLAHGWDTYLNGGDTGPGFVNGKAPYYTMGVRKQGSYEAFQYISGTPWSGYFSANFSGLNSSLSTNLTFQNNINPDPSIDNGMGISINFGKDAGTHNSISKIIFKCNAETAPVLKQTSVPCGSGSVNLSSFVVPLSPNPNNLVLIWRDSTGAEVANPTSVSKVGVYTVSYRDTVNSCDSPPSTFTITGECVATCTKPASTATPTAFTKLGISGYSSLQKDWPAKVPNGFIALESGFNGLVITRTVPGKITDPVAGMLIYDTSKNCFSLYNGTSWKCIEKSCND